MPTAVGSGNDHHATGTRRPPNAASLFPAPRVGGLPKVSLPLGLLAPASVERVLAESKMFCVFIALALRLPYFRRVSFLTRIFFSERCASGGGGGSGCNGNGL